MMTAMNMVLKTPNEAPYEAGKDLNVMVLGEDTVMAGKAYEILEDLELSFPEEGRLIHQWWDFEVLAFMALRELAAIEAATADIIIIGLRQGRELPEMVNAWIKRWLDLRKDRPGALVALLDANLHETDAMQRLLARLKQVAAEGHLDFFAKRAKEEWNDSGTFRSVKPPGNSAWCANLRPTRIAGRRMTMPAGMCGKAAGEASLYQPGRRSA